jgi:hypothetical protein
MIHSWDAGDEIVALSQGEAKPMSNEETMNLLVRFASSGLRACSQSRKEGEE